MSLTLVDTAPFPPHRQVKVRIEEIGTPVSLSKRRRSPTPVPSLRSGICCIDAPGVAQIARLASQHHTSDYNRLKYGPQGCPIPYIPLSVHLPDFVERLKTRQKKSSLQDLWWPCDANCVHSMQMDGFQPEVDQRIVLGPCGGSPPADTTLQTELSTAMREPLSKIPSSIPFTNDTNATVKTSESHPINISMMIPPESLLAISSHIISSASSYPVMFDVPLLYLLDSVTRYTQLFPSTALPTRPPSNRNASLDIDPYASLVPNPYLPAPIHVQEQSSVTEALQAAISTGLSAAPLMPFGISKALAFTHNITRLGSVRELRPFLRSNLNTLVTRRQLRTASVQERPSSAPPICVPSISPTNFRSLYTHHKSDAIEQDRDLSAPPSHTPFLVKPIETTELHNLADFSSQSTNLDIPSNPQIKLGNLFLSSCPGKKVRLDGPVKGRSTICRDLDADLKRMKDVEVACIVCCLDDEELDLLGITWSDYSTSANRFGIDILRVPLPEGLAPLSTEFFDTNLTKLINLYTLRGKNILAHCRGGVGRAGLIACCWMLKLGLCGWIETDVRPLNPLNPHLTAPDEPALVRRDTMQLVERAIAVVRRRRSVKAVETFEQVTFLVDFVEYLRAKGISTTTGA